MSGKVVCLGCGLIVDEPGDWGCNCPPPSLEPRRNASPSGSQSGPYRSLPPTAQCPRCVGRLAPTEFHDATVLDCTDCGGLYVPRQLIDALTDPAGRALRVAFPQRERFTEPAAVRYLRCPVCDGVMNRQNFGRISGVLVDVCSDHGIWFDAGEINAVIEFVEKGGMAKSEQRAREQQAAEKSRLREQAQRDRMTAREQPTVGRHRGILGRQDNVLVSAFLSWLDH